MINRIANKYILYIQFAKKRRKSKALNEEQLAYFHEFFERPDIPYTNDRKDNAYVSVINSKKHSFKSNISYGV